MADGISAASSGLDSIRLDKTPATTSLQASKDGSSKADNALQTLAGDFNNFLRLLTTQLKNQDPTEPLDTNQFTQQLVAFTGVEQAVATNKNLETLIGLNSSGQLNSAVGFIGKSIDAQGSNGVLAGGAAEFSYELPPGVKDVTVALTDATGRVVFSGAGSTKAGKNVVVWDGVNSFDGTNEPDGIYRIGVVAHDGNDNKLPDEQVKTFTTGQVTGVDISEDGIVLNVGTLQIPVDKVVSVRATPVIQVPQQQASNNSGDSESASEN